ncbi:RNA polymerase-binding protein DksA [Xylella fastidiosa subsp. multiplex]|uniref:RNA polymerase-binding transcription factor DksA n=2 Tax=Xylella fastidiosa TaxID=2371 RepID=A0AAW6HTD1_XYLFS|nr:RNA polymerase-binding protein DksA [Xylella fastidiosa subsp. multiplex]MDC6408034.1 RNA polymerase-binding protein DksA [Xylella fastidiosa subsp. multiplex]MDD0935427.1 RNA polymerase-binding protein DksA [Xylella fastidiosa subsp. multiplex]MSS69078.1 RNA polymerase-binding protein DksA [Xylella fastidiosa subsp. multiplex]
MAAKKIVKKIVPVVSSTAKPIGKNAAVAADKELPAKSPSPSAAKKRPATTKKAPVNKTVANKDAQVKLLSGHATNKVAKSVLKSASKPLTAESVPIHNNAVPAVATIPMDPKSTSAANHALISKSSAKTPAKFDSSSKPSASRPAGKVAVAVTGETLPRVSKTKYKVVKYNVDEATGRPILPLGYKPSSEEEYMNPLHQEYFRQRLEQWRKDLVEESKQTIENLRDEVRDIGDEAERATRETENSLELRTRDRYRKLIAKIDSTLNRLEINDYGYCVDTGEEIGLERLDARLTAERTIDAQERWEHLQKQQGD